ncbi:MAG: ferredoxin-thioredoxin reductase catalytic domain-containing protein [Bacillota bacterium]|nr:ferredoxin-thioredoxin reductase catalytic domain-containing protein [Bacillota bacterium]
MKHKIYCEVCRVSFIYNGEPEVGNKVVCTVCGAELEILETEPEVKASRFAQEPEVEMRNRAENYARLRGYIFNEDKELVMEGLIEKNRLFGDFYCPCRFENIPENVCPCLPTRMNDVRKYGKCY